MSKKHITPAKLENAVEVMAALAADGCRDIKGLCNAALAMLESPNGYTLSGLLTIAKLIGIIHAKAEETDQLVGNEAEEVGVDTWEDPLLARRVEAWEACRQQQQDLSIATSKATAEVCHG
jgi:hypothetical protein